MKTHLKRFLITCLVCIATTNPHVYAQGKTFFRYTNDQGSQVISDAIEPKYAVRGYDIIDSKGGIIKTVPAELSPEEKIRLKQEKEEQRRIEKWDAELLSRYSTVEDIQATKKRRLEGVSNSIYSLKLTLSNISDTIKHYQAEAAANERQGEQVSEDTLFSISRLQKDRVFFEQEIERKEKHKQELTISYDKDIQRFKIIKPTKN